jgi:hypothetical protein
VFKPPRRTDLLTRLDPNEAVNSRHDEVAKIGHKP